MKRLCFLAVLSVLVMAAVGLGATLAADAPVKAWEEDLTLPTYLAGPPDPNPMFYFGRAYQGAEGRVYPYPLYDTLTNRREERTYRMVYLENEFVKVGILPEIGGRIFSAVDKTNGYDYFYRQSVIKPALIGMLGAWISGGVEWNIPHHHRASSFNPVPYRIEELPDGGKTVWVGEVELRHRMRWAVGLTLRPGSSCLEARIRVMNRTPLVHTLLAWANVATHATEDYQVIFPPRTRFGTHHSKREFIRWPIADSFYGGSDFSAGVDVSFFRNHEFGNSIFAWNDGDEFLAGYDHGRQAGTLSVADPHDVPGKKLWTWGNGPGGRLWDRILTDEDGPYVELMVGAFSDNQPDYSWIQPYETRETSIVWYPFRDIGGVTNATRDAAVNLTVEAGKGRVGFYSTRVIDGARLRIEAAGKALLEETVKIGPGSPVIREFVLSGAESKPVVAASLWEGERELVSWSNSDLGPEGPMPEPVRPPLPPEQVETVEELYLTGRRIDQFHNPALDPEPYWLEALRRDPGESRVNTALGVLGLRRGDWQGAEQRLRKALERLTAGYTTPAEGDAHFYLGVALRAQGSDFEAERAFRKAAWNAAWNGPACYEAAELASRRGEWSEALQLLDRSLDSNRRNQRAWTLRAALLRVNGRIQEAIEASKMALSIDPLDLRAQAELRMAGQEAPVVQGILERFPAEGLEVAAEYVAAGLWSDAETVLSWMESTPSAAFSPLVLYLKGYVLDQTGRSAEAEGLWQRASSAPAGGVFPFQSEFIQVLRRVMASRPGDARPPYYLGTLLFDWQPDEAVRLWETAAALDPEFPIVHRNLGLAYARQEGGLERAIRFLERAVELGDHPIHLFELDQLYEAAAVSPERRLEMLERYHSRVVQRDDALARSVELKVVAGKYDEALELMRGRRFNVWEGGARFSVHDTWTDAHLLRGRKSLAASRPEAALADFEAAIEFPENLQVARFRRGGRHAEVAYWIGVAKSAAGDDAGARKAWEDAAEGIPVVGGDDILPTTDRTVQLYYQALALERLGKGAEAEPIYRGIVRSAQQALDRGHRDDFFAKFGEQQTWRAATAQAHFLKGLGLSGLGERSAAAASFAKALELRPEHLGARTEVP